MRAKLARPSHSSDRSRRGGYTLMELMVVVAITGVLAAVALPSMRNYVMRGRAGEAVSFLGAIALRQAAYRAEFGGYCGAAATMDAAAWVPGNETVMVGGDKLDWPGAADFDALGATPDTTQVRFGYAMCAGTPAQANANLMGAPYNVPAAQLDFYFIAQARADFDDDGDVMTFEISSFRRDMWSSHDKGWE